VAVSIISSFPEICGAADVGLIHHTPSSQQRAPPKDASRTAWVARAQW
jgi:hypothetical protein